MDTKICLFETFAERQNHWKQFRDKCLTECPINCFDVEYHQKVIQTEEHFDNDEWFNRLENIKITFEDLNLKTIKNKRNSDERPVERRIVWD